MSFSSSSRVRSDNSKDMPWVFSKFAKYRPGQNPDAYLITKHLLMLIRCAARDQKNCPIIQLTLFPLKSRVF